MRYFVAFSPYIIWENATQSFSLKQLQEHELFKTNKRGIETGRVYQRPWRGVYSIKSTEKRNLKNVTYRRKTSKIIYSLMHHVQIDPTLKRLLLRYTKTIMTPMRISVSHRG